jgi:hypothetical protein
MIPVVFNNSAAVMQGYAVAGGSPMACGQGAVMLMPMTPQGIPQGMPGMAFMIPGPSGQEQESAPDQPSDGATSTHFSDGGLP